ncbi:hypothetical protein L4D76_16660 [Photobacterium sagamiensis]|uniref:hypothetical protein n=1 Tax=Photobacterium sagamiensis TaxID=2910241 RepID=UPI003D0E38FC
MEIVAIVILFIVLLFVRGILYAGVVSRRKEEMEEELAKISDFSFTQKVMGNTGKTGMAIDEAHNKICLITHKGESISLYTIPSKDLLASEIFEDGVMVARSSRSGHVGEGDAVLGGLSGAQLPSDKVTTIDFRLTVNRTDLPTHDISFMNNKCARSEGFYKIAMQDVHDWYGMINALIHKADEGERAKQAEAVQEIMNSLDHISTADELIKLAELKS